MELLLAGVCILGLLAGVTALFLLTIPAYGESVLTAWRQSHDQMYLNSLEFSAAVLLAVLLILSAAAVWSLLG